MKKLLKLVLKKSNFFIVLIGLLTVFFGWQASQVSIDPNTDSLFPSNKEREDYLLSEFGVEEKAQQVLLLGVKDSDLMNLEKLKLYKDVIDEIAAYPEITSVLSPFNFPIFLKKGAGLQVGSASPHAEVPVNQKELEQFRQRLTEDPYAYGSVAAEEGTVLCSLFYNDNITNQDEFMNRFLKSTKSLNKNFGEVFYSGEIPFAQRTTTYLLHDLLLLIIIATVIMTVIFYLSFKTVRGVVLPMLIVIIGAVWSIGIMSLLNWKVTIVSITIPPLVLAIGSSYAIHILNEYYRNANFSEKNSDWLLNAVLHVNKTVLLAALTTTAGFISLLSSSIVPVKQFSLVVITGIITCAFMSLFLLPALLSKISKPAAKQIEMVNKGNFTVFMEKTGPKIYKHAFLFVIIFAVIFSIFALTKSSITYQADYLEYFPSDDPVIQNNAKILAYTGGTQAMNITLKAPGGTDKYFLQPESLSQIAALQEDLSKIGDVQKVVSFVTMLENANRIMTGENEVPEKKGLIMLLSRYMKLMSGSGLDADIISDDYNNVNIFLRVYDAENLKYITETGIKDLENEVNTLVDEYIPDEISSTVWGDTIMFLSTSKIMNREQAFSTILSLLMIFIITSIMFKSFKYGLVSLIPLFTGIMVYYISMALFKIPMDMTTIMVTNIAIGVGVDDSIHFLLQYRRQIELCGGNVKEALEKTFIITGRPIVLTTVAIVSGMLVFCFASFKPIVYFGLLVSVSLAAAMIGTLIFLPTALRYVNKRNSL